MLNNIQDANVIHVGEQLLIDVGASKSKIKTIPRAITDHSEDTKSAQDAIKLRKAKDTPGPCTICL